MKSPADDRRLPRRTIPGWPWPGPVDALTVLRAPSTRLKDRWARRIRRLYEMDLIPRDADQEFRNRIPEVGAVLLFEFFVEASQTGSRDEWQAKVQTARRVCSTAVLMNLDPRHGAETWRMAADAALLLGARDHNQGGRRVAEALIEALEELYPGERIT